LNSALDAEPKSGSSAGAHPRATPITIGVPLLRFPTPPPGQSPWSSSPRMDALSFRSRLRRPARFPLRFSNPSATWCQPDDAFRLRGLSPPCRLAPTRELRACCIPLSHMGVRCVSRRPSHPRPTFRPKPSSCSPVLPGDHGCSPDADPADLAVCVPSRWDGVAVFPCRGPAEAGSFPAALLALRSFSLAHTAVAPVTVPVRRPSRSPGPLTLLPSRLACRVVPRPTALAMSPSRWPSSALPPSRPLGCPSLGTPLHTGLRRCFGKVARSSRIAPRPAPPCLLRPLAEPAPRCLSRDRVERRAFGEPGRTEVRLGDAAQAPHLHDTGRSRCRASREPASRSSCAPW